MNYGSQVTCVVLFSVAWNVACFWLTHLLRSSILKRPLGITYVALAWTVVMISFAATVSATQTNPSGGLFTTTSWFNAGWTHGLSVFGIRIDSWWRYCIVVAFQTSRSILGSLLLNVFRPHLTVKVQALGTGRKALTRGETRSVMLAQASWNIFGFVSSLSDSFLMLSQIDLSIITLVITMIADSQSTYFIGEEDSKRIADAPPAQLGFMKLMLR